MHRPKMDYLCSLNAAFLSAIMKRVSSMLENMVQANCEICSCVPALDHLRGEQKEDFLALDNVLFLFVRYMGNPKLLCSYSEFWLFSIWFVSRIVF